MGRRAFGNDGGLIHNGSWAGFDSSPWSKFTFKLQIMELFIIIGLSILALALVLVILMQKADIEDLKLALDRMSELYMQESDRNIEKLREDIFRDDLEILNRWV